MSQDLTGNRELVWLIRLRQGPLFPSEQLSVEFLGTYEGRWDRDAVRQINVLQTGDSSVVEAMESAAGIQSTPVA